MEKPVSDAQNVNPASEKSLLAARITVSTTNTLASILEKPVSKPQNIVTETETIVRMTETIVRMTETIVTETETIVTETETIVTETETIVTETETIVTETETIVTETETIVTETETIVTMTETIVTETETIVTMTLTIVSMIEKIFSMIETIFSTLKNMVSILSQSFAPWGLLFVEQSFANPQLVDFEAPAQSHHYYFGEFRMRTTRQGDNSTVYALPGIGGISCLSAATILDPTAVARSACPSTDSDKEQYVVYNGPRPNSSRIIHSNRPAGCSFRAHLSLSLRKHLFDRKYDGPVD
jgi:hypothetical protein